MEKIKFVMTDTDTQVSAVCRRALEAKGIAVTVCEKNGTKALETLLAVQPQAVLLDAFMPDLDANGLGLAGPQVGMMRRLFICLDDRDLPEEVPANYEYKFIEFINPEILELSDEQVELYEGCLSFPGHNGAIKRSKHVKVKAQDRHGEWFELEADDMLARCIQHENNHLDGITIMDLAEHFYEDDYPEENED